MSRTIAELATLVGGQLVRGRGDKTVSRVMPIDGAEPDAVSFITKPKYLPYLSTTQAGVVMTSPKLLAEGDQSPEGEAALISVDNPYAAFARAAQLFARPVPAPPAGVHGSAVIAPSAVIEAGAAIGPFVLVGAEAVIGAGAVLHAGVHVHDGARIGAGSVLYDHVVVRHGSVIGERCILHPGVVVGADGFGFAQDLGASLAGASADAGVVHLKIPQTGIVVLEDEVEVGANTCIDRAALGVTRIGAGTKIDNLVQIGHNVEIGAACLIVAQSGVAGSTKLGRRVIMGAQSGISGHVTIGDGVTVLGQAGVMSDVEAGAKLAGTPAVPAADFFRTVVRIAKLDELSKKLKSLEKLVSGKG